LGSLWPASCWTTKVSASALKEVGDEAAAQVVGGEGDEAARAPALLQDVHDGLVRQPEGEFARRGATPLEV
jgi:hypothetical protein